MNDMITFAGNVGGVPESRTGANGSTFVSFRVGSSQGYYDRAQHAWVDQGTHWYSVVAGYELGANVLRSLKSGDAVIVTGRLKLKTWEREGRSGVSLDVTAEAVSINLAFGTAEFTRIRRGESAPQTAVEPDRWASGAAAQDTPAADPIAAASQPVRQEETEPVLVDTPF